jgi:hypothetical protein
LVGDDDIEHGDDVRVVNLRSDFRLVAEHGDELRILGELRMKALGRDDTSEPVGADQVREMNRRHSAMRDGRVEHIATAHSALDALGRSLGCGCDSHWRSSSSDFAVAGTLSMVHWKNSIGLPSLQ